MIKQPKLTNPEPSTHHCQYDPAHNPDVICLMRQDDGNWKGMTQRYGILVEVRQISPMSVLEYLTVHDGKLL